MPNENERAPEIASAPAEPHPAVIRAEMAASAAGAEVRAETAQRTTIADSLKDVEGVYSSKRVAAFLALFLFLAFAISDVIAHGGKPSEFIMNDLMFIVIAGLGMGLAESFAPKR